MPLIKFSNDAVIIFITYDMLPREQSIFFSIHNKL